MPDLVAYVSVLTGAVLLIVAGVLCFVWQHRARAGQRRAIRHLVGARTQQQAAVRNQLDDEAAVRATVQNTISPPSPVPFVAVALLGLLMLGLGLAPSLL